jgi:hypothetical protein
MAVKCHYEGDFPENLVALHNFKGGYCGLSKVETGHVNVCYLTLESNLKKYKDIKSMEYGILSQNPHLKSVFSEWNPVFKTPLSISQIYFHEKTLVDQHVLMVGDAAGLIYPLCGNGMAMAIHGAIILSEKIVEYFSKYPNKNLVCDTPYLYYHKNYTKKFVNKKKKNFYVWPTIFPTSSINLRKNFLIECLNNIFPKMFPQIEIDFRILVFADKIKNDLNLVSNNLTYYFQNPKGILSIYKKFSFYWWNKRFEAHKFMEFFYKKNKIKFIKTLDYKITYIMSLLSRFYFMINSLKLNSLHFRK